jgi:hypothetical protein
MIYHRTHRMIIAESKCRLLNNDEESEQDVSIPLIMYSHPFLHQILATLLMSDGAAEPMIMHTLD